MKVCRLKIIKANILENNIYSPQITYVSQNKNNKKEVYIESERKIDNEETNTPMGNLEEIIISKENNDNNIKLQEIIKSDREKNIIDKKEENLEDEKINEMMNLTYLTF